MELVYVRSTVRTGEMPRTGETPHFLDFKLLSSGGSYARIAPLDWLREVRLLVARDWGSPFIIKPGEKWYR